MPKMDQYKYLSPDVTMLIKFIIIQIFKNLESLM